MPNLKLGKLPARPYPLKFSLSALVDPVNLPTPPDSFGHETIIDNWGVLGNSDYGDCVIAGAAHETMLINKLVGNNIPFDDTCVLKDYTAITGFDPKDPATDQGTDVQDCAKYRRLTGMLDANGARHKIAMALALEKGNLTHLWQAAYLFDIVGIGIEFPSTAMDQFDKGKPWDVVANASIEGGHYVPFLGKRGDLLYVVTWGKLQAMTIPFLEKYCDEAWTYLSQEAIVNEKSPDGFDYALLQQAMRAL